MVEEFEGNIFFIEDYYYYEQKYGFQSVFVKDVKSFILFYEEMGNLFIDEGFELIVIYMKDVMDVVVVSFVQIVLKIGEEQFNIFVKE